MKDIIFVRTGAKYSERNWNILRARFPYAIQIEAKSISLSEVIKQAESCALTKSFWIIYDEITLLPTFSFEFSSPEWDEKYIHVWKYLHNFKPSTGGIYYVTKGYDSPIQLKPNKKLAGYVYNKSPSNFDIFFISYYEPNATVNLENIRNRYPLVKHIEGVSGIHNAHKLAAEQSDTHMFWVIDADAQLLDNFSLSFRVMPWDMENVYVWRSVNPVNNLSYGYGGVKLLPTQKTKEVDVHSVDMTTSISTKFVPVNKVSNITQFNVDPFNTWKSAFRECVKLSSKVIDKQHDDETEDRLRVWCTEGKDKQYGDFCIAGALAGKEYGESHKHDAESLKRINDFKWLHEQFSKYTVD